MAKKKTPDSHASEGPDSPSFPNRPPEKHYPNTGGHPAPYADPPDPVAPTTDDDGTAEAETKQ